MLYPGDGLESSSHISSMLQILSRLFILTTPSKATEILLKIGLESDFSAFLKQATSDFRNIERNVILQMDEIHVQSTVDYKGGRIIGYSMSPNEPIKTVFAIMASNLYRKWSQIVRLIACPSISAKEIFAVVKSVICDVERCGMIVQVICKDNYLLNVSFFKLFSSDNKTLTSTLIHPNVPVRKIILLFNFVHIIKSIRNNWLNLKDYERTFVNPNALIY